MDVTSFSAEWRVVRVVSKKHHAPSQFLVTSVACNVVTARCVSNNNNNNNGYF